MYGCSLITSGLFRSWVCKVVRLGRVGGERKCFVMADRIDRLVVSYYTCIEALVGFYRAPRGRIRAQDVSLDREEVKKAGSRELMLVIIL
jgi:hypothetical protein